MTIRQEIEEREKQFLSPFAALSAKSKGRKRPEKECNFRTCFQRDRDRIIHAKSFRRLKHKTQVFISPLEDHYRTRLTHTLEVAQIGRTIARALKLNEDLTEAIALAHDLGHTPFGHAGEFALDELLQKNYGKRYYHNLQSVRIVEFLEKDGKGLNLSCEVLDGIKNHTPDDPLPRTLEGQIVRRSDKIAYLRHDIEDAVHAGILAFEKLPKKPMRILGKNILDSIIGDIINNSYGKPRLIASKAIEEAVDGLYDFLYNNLYINPTAKKEEAKVPALIHQLFRYYHYNRQFQRGIKNKENQLQHTIDFIAGMTDRYAVSKYSELFVPDEWRGKR